MAIEYEIVSAWVGVFPSSEDLDSYLDETYSDDDSEPISSFAADQGEAFYDHDFLEFSFSDPSSDPVALLKGHSFSRSYGAAFAASFRKTVSFEANSI